MRNSKPYMRAVLAHFKKHHLGRPLDDGDLLELSILTVAAERGGLSVRVCSRLVPRMITCGAWGVEEVLVRIHVRDASDKEIRLKEIERLVRRGLLVFPELTEFFNG